MAARGGPRPSLADLITAVGDSSPVDGADVVKLPSAAQGTTSAELDELVVNPRNPRGELGDLSDLESIARIQLQPGLAVTRSAYLRLFPEDAAALGPAKWVVVNGCRRLAAARLYGCTAFEFVVKDEVAATRAVLLAVSIIENVARRGFDVLEEARAVESLVAECESAVEAAEKLKRTPAWVSQRRALLKLAPELQDALRRGDLAIREARTLASVPYEKQVRAWQAAQQRQEEPRTKQPQLPRVATAPQITKALRKFEAQPAVLAEALREYLGPERLAQLKAELGLS